MCIFVFEKNLSPRRIETLHPLVLPVSSLSKNLFITRGSLLGDKKQVESRACGLPVQKKRYSHGVRAITR